MTEEPKDEREIRGEIELHMPKWLPGVTASLSMQRIYEKRTENFLSATQIASGLADDKFSERLQESDDIISLIKLATEHLASSGNKFTNDAFAGLIASAMLDDATIDVISYLLPKLIGLQPVHIRILANIPQVDAAYDDENNPVHILAELAKAPSGVIISALIDLAKEGFIETKNGSDAMLASDFFKTDGWKSAPIAYAAGRLIADAVEEVKVARRAGQTSSSSN